MCRVSATSFQSLPGRAEDAGRTGALGHTLQKPCPVQRHAPAPSHFQRSVASTHLWQVPKGNSRAVQGSPKAAPWLLVLAVICCGVVFYKPDFSEHPCKYITCTRAESSLILVSSHGAGGDGLSCLVSSVGRLGDASSTGSPGCPWLSLSPSPLVKQGLLQALLP